MALLNYTLRTAMVISDTSGCVDRDALEESRPKLEKVPKIKYKCSKIRSFFTFYLKYTTGFLP